MRLLFLSTLIGCPPTEVEKPPTETDGVGVDADGDGWSVEDGDCDDADPARNPGVTEVCDGIDANCDGVFDNEFYVRIYEDADGDGYGDVAAKVCEGAPGYAERGGDCDDEDPSIHPRATEVCDEVDQDCDDRVDDGVQVDWFPDEDGDGYGAEKVSGCVPPAQTAVSPTDCDDHDATVHPGAEDIPCDDIDNDCSTTTGDGAECAGDTALMFGHTTVDIVLVDGVLVSGETAVRWYYHSDGRPCSQVRQIEQVGPLGTCTDCEWAFEYTLGDIELEGDYCDQLPDSDWFGIRESGELAFTYDFLVTYYVGAIHMSDRRTALTVNGFPAIAYLGGSWSPRPWGDYEYTDPFDVYTSGLDDQYWLHHWTITY